MDAELEIRRLQRRVQELEQENAELRAQLAAFGLSSSAQGKAGDTVLSAAQMPSNTAATLDAPAPNTVTPSHNRQSIPPAQSAPLSVARTSSPAEKIRLFRSLFRGRTDVYALRWHSEKAQKSGYSPVCANEWRPGLCEKGRVPCAKCPNRVLRPLDDAAIYRHLAGRDAQGRDVVGLYPMLSDETCYLLALDFDDANWQDCARAIADVCRAHSIPFALERSRSGQGAHVWLFFAEAIPCAKARRLGDALLTAAMDTCGGISFTAYDRMFPNQDTLPAGGFGNLIALPLQGQARRQGNSIFLNDSLTPYPDPWAFLSTDCAHAAARPGRRFAGSIEPRPSAAWGTDRTGGNGRHPRFTRRYHPDSDQLPHPLEASTFTCLVRSGFQTTTAAHRSRQRVVYSSGASDTGGPQPANSVGGLSQP